MQSLRHQRPGRPDVTEHGNLSAGGQTDVILSIEASQYQLVHILQLWYDLTMIQLKVRYFALQPYHALALTDTQDNDELHRQFGGSRCRVCKGHANETTCKDWYVTIPYIEIETWLME